MSLWSERERNIFTLKLGGAEKKFDPLKLARHYHQAVMETGGIEALKRHGSVYYSKPETSDQWVSNWHEAAASLAKIGRQMFGLTEWNDDSPDGVTDEEAIKCMEQYLEYSQKKEQGVENSPTVSTDSAPGQEGTNEESPTTPITSASCSPGT